MPGKRTDGRMEGGKDGRVEGALFPSFRRSLIPSFPLSLLPSLLRQLAGMPDYAAHLEHLHRYHPKWPEPTEREFYEEFVLARYGDNPTRCC